MEADFSGYATKANIQCADGRTIMPDAFKHMNGMRVPLVWSHIHSDPENILGHSILEARGPDLYAHCYFNDTSRAQTAKVLVHNKDIDSLSIYANKLVEKAKKVYHGMVREVSLVISGANEGAKIDNVNLAHGDDYYTTLDDEVIIHMNESIEISGREDSSESPKHPEGDVAEHSGDVPSKEEETIRDVYDSFSEKQKELVNYMMSIAISKDSPVAAHSDDTSDTSDTSHSDDTSDTPPSDEGELTHKEEGTNEMTTRNIFDQNRTSGSESDDRHTLSHDDVRGIVGDAIRNGSLKDAVDRYAAKHGIDDVDLLFPDAKAVTSTPEFNKRRTEWVMSVLNGARHTPFSRIKTYTADLTQEEARARGYIKGNYKLEEWVGVTKRTTSPTTIYKKQKLDRDDVLDITDFDVVAWLKGEMRIMLEEELARAVLIGDGRSVIDEDKIKDPLGASEGSGIRAILNDHELFVTTLNVNVLDANSNYEEVVDAVIDGMEFYKGTGTPTFYTTIKNLNMFLKAKDLEGRRYYKNRMEVAEALGVREIVTVEPMNSEPDLIGIVVNLEDYNIGADKGGEVSLFDDFDIDYNQQKYLMETRVSGALTKVKSALVVKKTAAGDTLLAAPTAPTYDTDTYVVTIPADANVTYKNADTSATLTAGAQAALTAGSVLNVKATADSGYYFANNAETTWQFRRRA